MTDRRNFLIGGAAVLSAAFAPRLAYARAATDRRFVFIIQRGAADGLAMVIPTGDPAFASLRGAWAEDAAAARKLDGMFALHPALTGMAGLYDSGQALFAHAVALPYRDRSHFDGQNVLETGGAAAYAVRDGWLNRLLMLLPREEARAIAVAATVPLALRGARDVASYAPSALPDASGDLMARVTQLYADDPQLHALWAQAMQTRQLAQEAGGNAGRDAAATGALAARLLAPADGARIAMIETGGWDTHAGQRGRLNTQLKALDGMVGALKTGLGPAWDRTLVLVATEFGRTARINGTGGTDHGTAAATMLLGGTVLGRRVVADWPGLAKLYEDRDLTPTTDLDALIAGAVAGHFGIDPARAMTTLFPGSIGRRSVAGLIRV
ncbi:MULTISPECIES: DUF1501 domain-containing protein [unclassified Sphingomonas]|uniref:DUF1501 domain-containing protein n=1 Tax=unclassified Sphingomonas TaxID=196159 RepID=UPI0006FBEC39|nr:MULTISPECIES: DUF1501 domain-containing protein [unclassified Sphingomonas]KQM66676.1 hypothetical protein ASE65_00855 [Sphingomonas sp. Leaf16]KQN17625.1 hypothetical protein ASE81_00235 [Sphingomonas sp. Leaf29]KQN23489.1 hypothetical protein ASE83_03115 [Sphingomonas sp. Leaf32]